jgi:hypothetical protein
MVAPTISSVSMITTITTWLAQVCRLTKTALPPVTLRPDVSLSLTLVASQVVTAISRVQLSVVLHPRMAQMQLSAYQVARKHPLAPASAPVPQQVPPVQRHPHLALLVPARPSLRMGARSPPATTVRTRQRVVMTTPEPILANSPAALKIVLRTATRRQRVSHTLIWVARPAPATSRPHLQMVSHLAPQMPPS